MKKLSIPMISASIFGSVAFIIHMTGHVADATFYMLAAIMFLLWQIVVKMTK